MKLRDLEYLVAVYEYRNFGIAAKKSFVSQPTLSGQLKKLESELGVILMERSTRSVMFTPAGEQVVAQAREMLHTARRIKAIAHRYEDPMQGDFHLGLIPTVGPFLLPKVITPLMTQFPQTKLYLHELRTEVLIEQLLSGKLDAVILAKLKWDHSVIEFPILREPFWLAVPTNDPLTLQTEPISEAVLRGKSILLLEDGHCLRDQAMGVCFSAGANEISRYQATSMDTLLHMVASKQGITLVPELAAQTPRSGITFLPFHEHGPSRDLVMLGRSHSTRKSALAAIAKFISEQL